jgi:RNA polymerase sigma-70 factor (ECF subfamily)
MTQRSATTTDCKERLAQSVLFLMPYPIPLAHPPEAQASPAQWRAQLARASAGDRAALGALFALHSRAVFRTAWLLTRCESDADDVTQDVFVKLPRVIGGFEGNAAQFQRWLTALTVREALTLLRKGRRRAEVSIDSVMEQVAPTERQLERISLESALSRLPDDYRTVFVLKVVEGFEHREISRLLGISVAASEVRLHRARRTLRELMGELP